MDQPLTTPMERNRAAEAWSRFYKVKTSSEPGMVMLLALIAFVASIPFEMSLSVQPGAFSVTTLIGYGFFVVAIMNMRRCFATPPPVFWLFVVYGYATTMTTLALSGGHMDEAFHRLTTITQLLIMVLVCSNIFRYPRFFFAALWSLGIACFLVAALHAKGFGASEIQHVGVETRETQFGSDPNFQSMLMGAGALAVLGLAHARRNVQWWMAPISWVMAGAMLYDMSRTGSRAGIVGFAVGMVSFVAMKDSPAKMLIRSVGTGAALLGGIAVALQSPLLRLRIEKTLNSSDTNGRDLIYGTAWKMFRERPLFGWGGMTNQYELFQRISLSFRGFALYSLDTHNQFLGVATETGIVGLIPFFLAIALCLRTAFLARSTPYGMIAFAILCETVASNNSSNGHVLKITWLAFAFALGCHWATQDQKVRDANPVTA